MFIPLPLDDEDDECHLWYSQRGIGDSRWRRCIFVSASWKSDRSFIVHFCLICSVRYTSYFISRTPQRMGNKKGFPVLISSISMHFSSVQQILSCESRHVESFKKRSWIPSIFVLRHLLRALWAKKCSFCVSVSPCRAPRGRNFLMTKFWIEKAFSRHW